jgi:hypothetical protein
LASIHVGNPTPTFAAREAELIENAAMVAPLLRACQAIEIQIDDLDRKVLKLTRRDAQSAGS